MKWKNLKDGLCPKCGAALSENTDRRTLDCTGERCTFFIAESKVADIIRDQNRHSHQHAQQEQGWERFRD